MPSKPSHATNLGPPEDALGIKVGGLLVSLIMRVLYATSRKKFSGRKHLTNFFDSGQPVIIASWHNRQLLAAFCYKAVAPKHRHLAPLVSLSKDGGLAAWAMRGLGMKCIRGSSSRGGIGALKQMVAAIKQGRDVAFTPDGPRGPLYTIHGGVIAAAKLSGAPIVPICFQAKRHKTMKSWDKTIVPMPFTTLHFTYAEPLFIPRNCSPEEVNQLTETLQQRMLELNEQSENFD